MKLKIYTLFVVTITIISANAQIESKRKEQLSPQKQTLEQPAYQLFSTQNMWTFIKLDTRNGKMWQVQYDVSGNNRGETILNSIPLVNIDNEKKGRYTLYPTQNMYNFILLDQIDGFTYQVQWSTKEENRFVIIIN